MNKKSLRGITVGEILLEDYLEPNEITQKEFAARTGIPASRINEIVKGRKRLTPEYAIRFAEFFGTSAELWLNLQTKCDLETVEEERGDQLRREVERLASA